MSIDLSVPSAQRTPVLGGLSELLVPYIDITKSPYSADKTGVGDCTAAFRSAFLVGGHIVIPKGDYKMLDVAYFGLPTWLDFKHGARILSSGAAFTDSFVFGCYAAVADLKVTGGDFVNTVAALGTAVRFGSGCSNVEVSGGKYSGFPQASGGCVYATTVDGMKILNNRFTSSNAGALLFGTMKNVLFQGNICSAMPNNGIRVSGSGGLFADGISIIDNEFYGWTGNQSPIYVTCINAVRHKNVVISGNKVRGQGIAFAAGGNADLISTFGVSGLTVTGNTISGAGDLCVAIETADNFTVTGNVCNGADQHGIAVQNAERGTVIGNSIVDIGKDTGNITVRASAPLAGVALIDVIDSVLVGGNTVVDTAGGGGLGDYAVSVYGTGATTNVVIGANQGTGMTSGNLYVPAGKSVQRVTTTAFP